MKVLLKSFKELEEEYGVERGGSYLIINNTVIVDAMVEFLGKIVEAEYDKESNSYIINCWYYDPKFVKGEIIKEETIYTIRRLDSDIEYTLSF